MKSSALFLSSALLLGTMSFAHAGDLDLRLPDTTRFGTPYTPPGAAPAETTDPLAAEDDGKAHVHGSFTTGIGYSKGYGNSNFNEAHINVSKTVGDDHPTRMSLDIRVSKSNGPGGYYGGYGGYGPYGPYDLYDDDGYDGFDGVRSNGFRDARGRGPAW